MSDQLSSSAQAVLDFWFGSWDDPLGYDLQRMPFWFGSGTTHDGEVRERFGEMPERATRGELDTWRDTTCGTLALVVVLDQFSRHVYRGIPSAFAQDAAARDICLSAMSAGTDIALRPIERVFFYLPLEHAEDRDLQRRSVQAYRALVASLPVERQAEYETFVDYAVRHADVIERFGRFPHRNAVLGRASSNDELTFLEQPGSSFG